MTDRQVRDEVMTLFMAGPRDHRGGAVVDLVSARQHPEADARLAEELRAVLGGRPPAVADLPALHYAEMVISESMRLYPPAYAHRAPGGEADRGGRPRLAPGSSSIVPTWVVHRDPRWFEEPEAFRPERWADDLARRLPRFAYFPFGGGPRQCIGNAFAMMEAVLLLATIAQRFRLSLAPGQRVTPTPYVTLRPEPGVRMRLARR